MITQHGPQPLLDELKEAGIAFELLPHPRTSSAVDEAKALGVGPDEVGKTLVLRTAAGFVRAVIPACDRLDLTKVCLALDEHRVRLLDEKALAEAYPEFELGAVPPIGGARRDRILVDLGVCEHESVLLEAGTHSQSVRLSVGDLVAYEGALIVDICAD